MNLATRLTIAMVILAAATAIAIGFLAYRNLETFILPVAIAQHERDALEQAHNLEAIAREARNELTTLVAGYGGIQTTEPPGPEHDAKVGPRIDGLLANRIVANPEHLELSLLDDQARETLRAQRTLTGAVELVRATRLQDKSNRDFSWIARLLAEEGNLTPANANRIYVAPIVLDEGIVGAEAVPVLRLAASARGVPGDRPVIIVLTVDMRSTLERVRTAPQGAEVFVVGAEGEYLVAPDRTKEFRRSGGATIQAAIPALAPSLSGGPTTMSVDFVPFGAAAAVPAIAVSAPAMLGEGARATVIGVVPTRTMLAARSLVLRSAFLGGLGAMLAALLFAVAIANTLARPLAQMAATVGAGAGADLDVLPTGGATEVGILARAIRTYASEIRASETRFSSIFQMGTVMFAITELADQRYREVNEAFLAAFGLKRREVIGKTAADVGIVVENRPQLSGPVMRGGSIPQSEVRVRTPTGKPLTLLMSVKAIELDGRQHALTTALDITEHKKQEEQLRQSQKMEVVGQLTGGIAHDFNNLLTVVLGNIELLLAGLKQADLKPLGEAAIEAGRRGADLTARLLTFSRRQALQPVALDINQVVRDAILLLRRTLGEQVDIHEALAKGLPAVFVDRAQLDTAIVNLAVNARDAMPLGGKLTFETDLFEVDETYSALRDKLKPGRYVRLCVSDTGTGMPPEIVSRAFEPFFTTKAAGKGTGLGLSMVYGFAKQSGGHAGIYSEVGHGTIVSLYLPLAVSASELARTAQVDSDTQVAGTRILVVEDQADVRELVEAQLRSLGCEVVAAFSDGRAVLAAIESLPEADILLTDMILPGGLNGREVAEALAIARPGLRVLFASGYSQEIAAVKDIGELGGVLLRKPYRRADLVQKIRQVMDGPPFTRTKVDRA